jgi:hypothetical protein
VSVETESMKAFELGSYWTADGQRAVVDAVADGMLIGRIDLNADREDGQPYWMPFVWQLDGTTPYGANVKFTLRAERPPQRIQSSYWVNIYTSGPGQLRKNWEEALVEASRCEEPCLCRVEVKVDARLGEGLK